MSIQYVDSNADMVGSVSDSFNISGSNDQVSVAIDGGSNQVFTLTHGATRTAAQIVTDLSGLTSATASVVNVNGAPYVRIRTTSANGASSTILVNAPANNANSTLGFIATTYTGGANVSSHFVGNTKQNIIDGITTALIAAGWVVVSGQGTTTCVMQSSMSPNPQNLRMRVTLKDNSGSNTQVTISNVSGTKAGTLNTSAGIQLAPATSKGFQVIADKYQFFVVVPGSIQNGDFGACGVPYLPSWLQGVVWEAIWLAGGTGGNGTGTNGFIQSFRTSLSCNSNTGFQCPNQVLITNNNFWEATSGPTASAGSPCLAQMIGSMIWGANQTNYRWHDGSALMVDPIISWGLTQITDEGLFRGQLWDAFISNESYPMDTALSSIDSHNWQGITHNNGGNNASNNATNVGLRGTLFLVVP